MKVIFKLNIFAVVLIMLCMCASVYICQFYRVIDIHIQKHTIDRNRVLVIKLFFSKL